MKRDPHILIARYRDLEVRDMTPIRMGGMAGIWRVEKFKACGRDGLGEVPGTRRLMCEMHNIITNGGLNQRGGNPAAMDNSVKIHCGEGTATPTVSDTALANWTAQKAVDNSGFAGTMFVQTTPPYFGSHQRKARFAAGFAGGAVNITELGASRDTGNTNMFTRVLTLDGGGSPAAVPIDADEAFDAYYTLENYPDHVSPDGSGSVDISGTVYNYTIRAARVTSLDEWTRRIFFAQSGLCANSGGTAVANIVYGSDATLGAVTSVPAATSTASVNSTAAGDGAYVTDTFQRKITYSWALTEGNVTGGIKAMMLVSNHSAVQLLFDTPIPKTGAETLSFPLTSVWSRHV